MCIPYVQMAGQAKENHPGGSLKYQLVYLKFHILDVVTVYIIIFCIYIYIYKCIVTGL